MSRDSMAGTVTTGDIHVNPNISPLRAAGAELAAALVAAQAEFAVVEKDAKNPFFNSTYADLPAVMAVAQPVLAKHGLAVSQKPSYVFNGDKVFDTLVTELIHESGQRTQSTMILRPVKNDPQAQGSAITYARRYSYMAVLGLVADSDDDGNAASAAKPRAARTAKKASPDDEAADAVKAAVTRVKAAAKAAGATPTEATEYFKANNDGASLIASTDIDALTAAAVYYETKGQN